MLRLKTLHSLSETKIDRLQFINIEQSDTDCDQGFIQPISNIVNKRTQSQLLPRLKGPKHMGYVLVGIKWENKKLY